MRSIAIENGTVRFLGSGEVEVKYTAKIKKENLQRLISSFIWHPIPLNNPADNMENIIISYPAGAAEKEIKTVI
jgi:hypothetical protein